MEGVASPLWLPFKSGKSGGRGDVTLVASFQTGEVGWKGLDLPWGSHVLSWIEHLVNVFTCLESTGACVNVFLRASFIFSSIWCFHAISRENHSGHLVNICACRRFDSVGDS